MKKGEQIQINLSILKFNDYLAYLVSYFSKCSLNSSDNG